MEQTPLAPPQTPPPPQRAITPQPPASAVLPAPLDASTPATGAPVSSIVEDPSAAHQEQNLYDANASVAAADNTLMATTGADASALDNTLVGAAPPTPAAPTDAMLMQGPELGPPTPMGFQPQTPMTLPPQTPMSMMPQTPLDGSYQPRTPAPNETPYYQPETPAPLSVRPETPAPLSVAPPSVRTEYDISAELDRVQAESRVAEEAEEVPEGLTGDYEIEEHRWNQRSIKVLNVLRSSLAKGPVMFSDIAPPRTNLKKQAAMKFYTLLNLKKIQAVDVHQPEPYADIEISQGINFNKHL